MRRSRLGEEGEDVLACGGFLSRRYAVLEIVGDGVYGERAGFLEELGGRGGDIEQCSSEDGGCFGGHSDRLKFMNRF